MTIVEFIKKYDLFKTFLISELTKNQLLEFISCKEFSNVEVFNIIKKFDEFFIKNPMDFNTITLKEDTTFNHRINIHSIHVYGTFSPYNINNIKNGISKFIYRDNKTLENCGIITYKFSVDKLKSKFLTEEEIEKFIYEEVRKNLESENNVEYTYRIGIRAHKDSFIKKGAGDVICLSPNDVYKKSKLFD